MLLFSQIIDQTRLHTDIFFAMYGIWHLNLPAFYIAPKKVYFHAKNGREQAQITRFMWPTWGPPGADRTQVGPMLAPWTLLSWNSFTRCVPRVVLAYTNRIIYQNLRHILLSLLANMVIYRKTSLCLIPLDLHVMLSHFKCTPPYTIAEVYVLWVLFCFSQYSGKRKILLQRWQNNWIRYEWYL